MNTKKAVFLVTLIFITAGIAALLAKVLHGSDHATAPFFR